MTINNRDKNHSCRSKTFPNSDVKPQQHYIINSKIVKFGKIAQLYSFLPRLRHIKYPWFSCNIKKIQNDRGYCCSFTKFLLHINLLESSFSNVGFSILKIEPFKFHFYLMQEQLPEKAASYVKYDFTVWHFVT